MKKLFILLAVFILAAGFVYAQEQQEETTVVQSETQAPQAQPAQTQTTQTQTTQTQTTQVQPSAQEAPAEEETKRAIEILNVEISMNFPVHWSNGLHDDSFYQVINEATGANMMEDKSVTANTSIGIGINLNITKSFGIALNMDIFYAAKIGGFSSPTSDYNSIFGINAFFGPVFYLFNNGTFRIPLAVGAHMYYFNDDLWVPEIGLSGAWMNRSEMQFGPAVSIGVQFHFNTGIYLFTRTQIAIDLIRIHSLDWYNGTDYEQLNCTDIMNVNWAIKPVFGIGIKY
ncbi:MAG: hypothetical protein FWB77_06400 [Treponema sp.]|nr:hypothetical protein [Treponema sp.]